ncbi:MAG: hypothetical protein JXR70_06170 [Spirochaetales bacterium]|nr:hypothetical protein [Spirochaetales bacterium]
MKVKMILSILLLSLTFSAGAQMFGDVNDDQTVNVVDALLIAKYYVNVAVDVFNEDMADVNCSGNIDIVDGLLIARFYIKLINQFPCQGPTSTPVSTPTPEASPVFHVFLLLGQSNMAGFSKAQAADKVEDPRIQVLGFENCSATGRVTDQWDIACPPLHECWNGAVGIGDWFAKTLIQYVKQGDTIGLVPCAISGERIETFMKNGGSKYNWIIERARNAQNKGGVIEGIIFHQGESNSGDTSWPGKVATLIRDIKSDLGLGNIPFIAGELLYSGSCAGHNTLINQLPNSITNCSVVSANGLLVDPSDTQWRLHFGHDDTVEFGKRFAAKMKTALGW